MTMTIDGGRWLHHTESEATPPDCGGGYEIRGTRVVFTADEGPDCGGPALVFSGRWSPAADGIRFTDIEPAGAIGELVWGTPWRRIS